MSAASPLTPTDIAQAMKAKAEDAFGQRVSDPFTVKNIVPMSPIKST